MISNQVLVRIISSYEYPLTFPKIDFNHNCLKERYMVYDYGHKEEDHTFIIPIFSKSDMESINKELANGKCSIEFGLRIQ